MYIQDSLISTQNNYARLKTVTKQDTLNREFLDLFLGVINKIFLKLLFSS